MGNGNPDPITIDVTTERGQIEALELLKESFDLLVRNNEVWAQLPRMYVDLWDDTEVLNGCTDLIVIVKGTLEKIAAQIPNSNDEALFIKCRGDIIRMNDRCKATFMSKMFVALKDKDAVYEIDALNYFAGLIIGYSNICQRLDGIIAEESDYALPSEAFDELRRHKSECRAKINELTLTREKMISNNFFNEFTKRVADQHGKAWKNAQKFIEDAMTQHAMTIGLENARKRQR